MDAVAEAEDHTLRVYKLITWAERTGHIRALIDGAVEQNSDNPRVKRLAAESHTWHVDKVANRAPPQNVPPRRPDIGDARGSLPRPFAESLRYLDFKGMGMADRVPLQLPLLQMYVPLKAVSNCHRARLGLRHGSAALAGRPVTDDEAAAMGERVASPCPYSICSPNTTGLIILGDPGAGQDDRAEVSGCNLGAKPGYRTGAR